MKVRISEAHLRDLIRAELISEAEEKDAAAVLQNDSVRSVLADAEAFAGKLTTLDKDAALKLLKSDTAKSLQRRLGQAMASAGVDELSPNIRLALMATMKRDMADDAAKAEVEMDEAQVEPAGASWVDTSNDLGNLIELIVNGAGLVLALPFILLAGAAQYVGHAVKEARLVSERDTQVMNAVFNATVKEDPSRIIKWIESNRDEVDTIYKKYRGWKGKLKDKEKIARFTSAYEELFGGQKALPAGA